MGFEVVNVIKPGSDEGQTDLAGDQGAGGQQDPQSPGQNPGQNPGNQGAGDPNPNQPNAGGDPNTPPQPDYSWLTEVSGGTIKDKDQLSEALKDYNQLKTASQQPREPQFPNEAAKKVYEFALGYAGKEMDAVNKYFQIQQINLETADDRQKLFTKFMLDNPELDANRAQKIFQQDMEERYPDDNFEDNELLKFKFEQEVKNASAEIAKLQKEYNEALQQKPAEEQQQDPEALKNAIAYELPNFKGMNLSVSIDDKGQVSYGDADTKNPMNNFTFDIPQDKMSDFKSVLENPAQFWNQMFLNEDGQLDPGKYMRSMFNIMFGSEIQREMGSNLYARGKADMLKELKGIRPPDPSGSPDQQHPNPIVQGIRDAKRSQGS